MPGGAEGTGRMKRAAELFVVDEWGWDSGFVAKAWRTQSEPEPAFISVATSHWQIVVTTQRDLTRSPCAAQRPRRQ